MSKKFNVVIHYEGAMNYEVDAPNEDEAKVKAEALFGEENGELVMANVASTEICECDEIPDEDPDPGESEQDEPKPEPDNPTPPVRRATPYERTRAAVYATGNRWAIENFHATHD